MHRLSDLAAHVGGQVFGDQDVTGVADPADAGPSDLVFLLEPKYADAALASPAAMVVKTRLDSAKPQIVVANPRLAMARIMALFARPAPYAGVHPTAVIDPTAVVDPSAMVGPYVTVGAHSVVGADTLLHAGVAIARHVTVGVKCILYPRVVVYDDCVIGDRVILHAGTVVGSDGYGFTPDERKRHLKIPQLGNVVIGDDVETGANVAIDRATMGSTVIGRGTKLDNLVHIGHNDRIGEDCLIVSQTGLSGSVTVGDRVTLAGQVGVAGHLDIGSDSMVLARAGVTKSLPAKSFVSGFPARPHREELKRMAAVNQIDALRKELDALRAQLSIQGNHPFEEQPYDR
ncbi:MAG: UDP-3-O-[3-hydroxymyristoyl] N-acetylglucosamine deacetylase [Cyanobacteria bacterium RYN_339]|nr:UDP-3-O-[3-hydroxymyristoyl] N-acetylglucosamine deacetylase [Cyanobacteria bacterium RYN_339]